jgi:hypothetical protein
MAIIKIPRPPASAVDKDRPVSSLLRSHLEHMQEAEFRLPAKMQTNVYINAIKTEGEAAEYIRKVTERLHASHGSQLHATKASPARGRGGLELAASAAEPAARKRSGAKKKAGKRTIRKKRS